MYNPAKLIDELNEQVANVFTHVNNLGKHTTSRDLTAQELALIQNVLDNHDPIDYIALRKGKAKALFLTSALSSMTITEAESWIDTNIDDAKTALALTHVIRMQLGMRDWIMADIRGQQED